MVPFGWRGRIFKARARAPGARCEDKADCSSIELLPSLCQANAGIVSMLNFRLCTTSLITALIVACYVTGAFAIPLTLFRYESQAQRHCGADVVVWLDFRKGIYYSKRQRWYGRGFTGSFVCRKEARAGAYRRSLLGLR
jgi:hypothetical protein